MRESIKLADGEAKINDSIWYVNASSGGLKSVVLEEFDFLFDDSLFNQKHDSSTPYFCTKSALWEYCKESDIECLELERDVLKERLEQLEKPKTDIEKFMILCADFGINISQTLMAGKNGSARGSFIGIHDEEMEIRFVFGLYGDFKNFYFVEE